MYSLLVTSSTGAWEKPDYIFDVTRYLEFTDEGLAGRLRPVTDAVATELRSLPTVFAYETYVELPARVGWLKSIKTRGSQIRVTFALDPNVPPIEPERLEALSWDLDIGGEMSRTHWAVKDRDLLAILRDNGLIGPATAPTVDYHFKRQTLLKASCMLQTLGHSGFDQFILELGVANLTAGRDCGGLLARSNALGAYVIEHAREFTAEGTPLGLAVVRRATQVDHAYPKPERLNNLSDELRTGFWSALKEDGYALEGGALVPVANGDKVETPPYEMPFAEQPLAPQRFGRALSESSTSGERSIMASGSATKIFLVHGRDNGPKHEVARFLERLGLEPVILHEQPNKGRTLISKFQEESADIRFAVVLMTPDDRGGLAGEDLKPRARQNVIFELGFFIGKLGAHNVCALFPGNIERPSDFEAVVYVEYGPNTAWKTDLARELKAANIAVDLNKVL